MQSLKILFTGDIEKLAEDYLVQKYHDQLKSDVLIVPHHGSKTSSSPNFIHQIAAKFAIISAGIDNRYHFPHGQTLHISGVAPMVRDLKHVGNRRVH